MDNLQNQYNIREKSFICFKTETNKIIDDLITKSKKIINDVVVIRNRNNQEEIKIIKIQIPQINEERLLRSINHSVESIIKSNNLISENLGGIKSIIIQKTSLIYYL